VSSAVAYIRHYIIEKLATGNFVSGEILAAELTLSRNAISKHIKAINDMGIEVFSVKGKGYKFAKKMSLISKAKIAQALEPNNQSLSIELFTSIESTNSFLLSQIQVGNNISDVCIAEHQSKGRGRRGRQWVSPCGANIYFSMHWYLENGISEAMGLSMATALAVSDMLKEKLNITAELKWPNDVYVSGKKLAGILIDLEGQGQEFNHSVIGIGLNIDLPDHYADVIDQDWTDLVRERTESIDRNLLLGALINKLRARLYQHRKYGISSLLVEWHKHDIYLNQIVKLMTGEHTTTGIYRGVNEQGGLLLEIDENIKPYYGGEVSLRVVK
jgi:BirA family biotin operon repressor/biotin-[acetyl-CoA-carboxylase] ligase